MKTALNRILGVNFSISKPCMYVVMGYHLFQHTLHIYTIYICSFIVGFQGLGNPYPHGPYLLWSRKFYSFRKFCLITEVNVTHVPASSLEGGMYSTVYTVLHTVFHSEHSTLWYTVYSTLYTVQWRTLYNRLYQSFLKSTVYEIASQVKRPRERYGLGKQSL